MQSLEEKLTTKWYRDYSHKLHIQRLQEIKTHASKRIDNSEPRTKDSIVPQKHGKEFLKKEKKKSITKNNQQLLKILTEITAGKRETTTQKILNSTRDAPTMKSLNITVRKKEARRIDEDNEDLVRRLNDKKPGVSFKKLQEEWSIMNKYRESISKRGYRNGSSNMTSRLPPMDESQEKPKNEGKKEENLSKTLNSINLPKIKKGLKVFSVNPNREHEEESHEEKPNLSEPKEEKPQNLEKKTESNKKVNKVKERKKTEKNLKESQEDLKENFKSEEKIEDKGEKIEDKGEKNEVEVKVEEKNGGMNNEEELISGKEEFKKSEKNQGQAENKFEDEEKDREENEKSEEYSEDNEEGKDKGEVDEIEIKNNETGKIENIDDRKEVVDDDDLHVNEAPLEESNEPNLAEKNDEKISSEHSNPKTPDPLITNTENPVITPHKEVINPEPNPNPEIPENLIPDSPKSPIPEDHQEVPAETMLKQSSSHSLTPNTNELNPHPEIPSSDPVLNPIIEIQEPPIE